MKIEDRDENFKPGDSLQVREKKFKWYKHFISHGTLKIREEQYSVPIFAPHYYLDPEKYKSIPALLIQRMRTLQEMHT
ncbi:hypothetical protein CLU96_2058 [Chryseobacterium sp. 52]|uniref:hypothetical protein n=1 Tax=Chryseobacterium sp. 52 TaxID=2035213 RepID=UPI000C1927F3|nr:hypothetical protein [Chryseobacterium sp. 52]PIF45058.1 hypothetical protein CLU96_2058 [Chryseobacterium sp. 52]